VVVWWVVGGGVVFSLFALAQVGDVAIHPSDKLISLSLQCLDEQMIAIRFVVAGVEIVDQLFY